MSLHFLIFFLIFFSSVELFSRGCDYFKFEIGVFVCGCFSLLFVCFFYDLLVCLLSFNLGFLKESCNFLFLAYCVFSYLVFKLIQFFFEQKKPFINLLISFFSRFVVRRINYIFISYFIFYFWFFSKNYGVFECYYSATSFVYSLPIFFFVQFNTFSLLILCVAYFMLVIAYGTDIKGLTAGIFFSRCIFLSIFFGVILDVVALLLLNSVLAYNLDEDKKLNGLVMLFQNLLRIDTKNLIFLIQLSLIIFFF